MPSYAVNIIRNVGRPSIYENALKAWGMDIIQWVQNYMIANDRIATGDSISSFEMIIDENDIVIYAADTVGFALQGRTAGTPPAATNYDGNHPNNILDWIIAKPVEPYPDPKTGKIPTLNQLAFLIARSIGEHGTKPPKLTPQNLTAVVSSKGLRYQKIIGEEHAKAVQADFISVFKRSRIYQNT